MAKESNKKKVIVDQSSGSQNSSGSNSSSSLYLFLGVVVLGLAVFGATSLQPKETSNSNVAAAAEAAASALSSSNNLKKEKEVASDGTKIHLRDLLHNVDVTDYYEFNHFLDYDDHRTIAKMNLKKLEKIVDVPRIMQMLDVDAFANPIVRSLFGARHKTTYQPIDHKAFMAVHLMLMKKKHVKTDNIQKLFLNFLPPSWEKEFASHPVLRDNNDFMAAMTGNHSLAYILASQGRERYLSEYDAMVQVSSELPNLLTKDEYVVARLWVGTRSFNTGPVTPEVLAKHSQHLAVNIDQVKSQLLTWDFEKVGCTALVPIVDRFNHHANPNVGLVVNRQTLDFTLATSESIPAGNELFISFGDKMDSALYATYGFVNGDGSERTGVSLAAFHFPHDPLVSVPYNGSPESDDFRTKQFTELVRYLQYDDGYHECVTPTQENAQGLHLKGLKLRLLELIANKMDKWIFAADARNPTAVPPKSIRDAPKEVNAIPSFDLDVASRLDKKDEFSSLNFVLSTCRILALTHHDYAGNAITMLYEFIDAFKKDPINAHQMVMEPGNDSLEYRAHAWLHRLAKSMLKRYGTSSHHLTSKIAELNKEGKHRSVEWMEAHVLLGEVQSLELLIKYANDYMDNVERKTDDDGYVIRQLLCPVEYSMPIVPNFTAIALAKRA